MEKLDQMFWIDQQKLKDITAQFEVELDLGLKKNNQNIVCISNLLFQTDR
jgi:hexokinase